MTPCSRLLRRGRSSATFCATRFHRYSGPLLMPLQLRVMFGPPKIPQRFKQGFPISMTLRPWQIRQPRKTAH